MLDAQGAAQLGLEVGTIAAAAWSRFEAKRAKNQAKHANERAEAIQHAVQPNGQTLAEILHELKEQNAHLTRLASGNNSLLRQVRRLLADLVKLDRYLHRRNHAILDGIFAIRLGNSTILRKLGIQVPDPEPYIPDELTQRALDRDRDEHGD